MTAFHAQARAAWHAVEAEIRAPEDAHATTWRAIRERIACGRWWRANGVVDNLDDAPITTYADYQAALDDAAGYPLGDARSPLTGDVICYWNETSGTTGRPKRFPLTRAAFSRIDRQTMALQHRLIRDVPGYLAAPTLNLFAPASATPNRGLFSNFNHRHKHHWLRRAHVLPPKVYASADAFAELAGPYALARDISAISGMAPARLHAFIQTLPDAFARLRAGRTSAAVSRARMVELERAFAESPLPLSRVWPSLRLISLWTTGSCALQLPLVTPHVDREVTWIDNPYGASEGVFAFPFRDVRAGHASLHSAILEFAEPAERITAADLRKPWQLEPGRRYELVVTTPIGLVRYRMFDVVVCRGFDGKTPLLEFVRKAGARVSLGGGGMAIIDEADLVDALTTAAIALPPRCVFAPAPRADGLALYVAGDHSPPGLARIDSELQRVNPGYQRAIASGSLRPIVAVTVVADRLHRASHAQAKQPLLVQDPP